MKEKTRLYFKAVWVLMLAWVFVLQATAQQTSTISGTVADNTNEPVIGASVLVKGTSIGSITDLDGRFTLANVPANGTIIISYIGYITQEIAVKGQKNFAVKLLEDSKTLDEVVVVGYGVQRKSDLTGAVASVKATDALKATPSGNISEALQGRLAGVSIIASGDPSKDASIRVRGVNSLLASAEGGPLVVVDGFIGGSLQSLNPSDIQSIEVLKDASATAVYGSRGANGVILVTTKTPNKDKLTVSINAFVNLKTSLSMPDRLSAAQYADMANAYGKEFNASDGNKPAKEYFNPEQIQAFREGKNTFDYVKAIFRDPAVSQNYDLSITGGSEKTSFLASFRYEDNNGIIKESQSDRFNWRLKVDTKIKKWLSVGANFWGDYRESSGPRISEYEGLLNTAINYPSIVMPTDDNGNYNNITPLTGSPLYNPMGYINELDGKNQVVTNRLQGYVDFNIIDGLTFRSQLGVTFGNTLNTGSNTQKSYSSYKNGKTDASANTKWAFGWLNTNSLNYTKEFNKNHRINATAVFEQSYNNDYTLKGSGTGLLAERLGADALDWAERLSTSSERTITSLLSGLFRVNYVLMNKYALTASIRADGSSRLADKWAYFPSAAVAWTVSEEAFMKDVDFISQFKVRAGYGSVGNQGVEAYRIYSKMKPTNVNGVTVFNVDRPAAPFLKWERNDQVNIGLDMGFFNGRLTASFDWYNKKSKDILLEVEQAQHTGWGSLLKNAGALENKGFEITIGADPISNRNWNWHTDITLSHNEGRYTHIPTRDKMQVQAGTYANQIFKMIEGEKLSSFWGNYFEGVWKSDEVGQTTTVTKADGTVVTDTYQKIYGVKPGEAKYKDVNNDGVYDAKDQGIIGNGQPTFNWGWSNTLRYKDLDLSIFIIGVHGFDIYNVNKYSSIDAVPTKTFILDRWTKDNENTNIPGFVKPGNTSVSGYSSRNVEKGDFVKIKNITLGYTLPQSICKRLYLNSFRVYGSVQNPFLISKYSGLDPEVALSSPLTSGVDWEAYPNGRNYILGVNLSF